MFPAQHSQLKAPPRTKPSHMVKKAVPAINSEGADKVYAEISDDTVVCGGVYQS